MMDFLMVIYALWIIGMVVVIGIVFVMKDSERKDVGYLNICVGVLLSWFSIGRFLGYMSQEIDKLED